MKAALRALARIFFREIEVTGLDLVPQDRGGIVVSWHPNGLIDPWLILAELPRPVVFGARYGLFRWPLLGALLWRLGTVPIYRGTDAAITDSDRRRDANSRSLDALARIVANGSFTALFPEGVSHDEPHPVELKTGLARLYYQARGLQAPGAPAPAIVPVGLHYDRKRLFRSRVLVSFEAPMELPGFLDVTPPAGEPEQVFRERCRKLTAEIERTLHEVVHATDDWAIHQVLHRTRKLVRAERARRAGAELARPDMRERALGFARVRTAYYARVASQPDWVASLRRRVETYDADLKALGLEDHDLDRDPRLTSPWLVAILMLQVIFVFLLMPPILFVGYIVNGPTALGLIALSRMAADRHKDEATIKILVGLVAFPLTWLLAGVLAATGNRLLVSAFPYVPDRPLMAGILFAVLGVVGGAVALRYLHVAQRTWRAVRVRLTRRVRRRNVERLRAERASLHNELMEISEGLELAGVVAPDGSIRAR